MEFSVLLIITYVSGGKKYQLTAALSSPLPILNITFYYFETKQISFLPFSPNLVANHTHISPIRPCY